jgi:hypothetical protein
MATPVTDLSLRLRNAGVSEEQADAVAGAFEALSNQMRRPVVGQRIQIGLLLVVVAADLAPTSRPWPTWLDNREP